MSADTENCHTQAWLWYLQTGLLELGNSVLRVNIKEPEGMIQSSLTTVTVIKLEVWGQREFGKVRQRKTMCVGEIFLGKKGFSGCLKEEIYVVWFLKVCLYRYWAWVWVTCLIYSRSMEPVFSFVKQVANTPRDCYKGWDERVFWPGTNLSQVF